MLNRLKAALGASWLLFTRGGLWVTGVAASLVALGILRLTDGRALSVPMTATLMVLLVGFSVFISLAPFWMTLMSFCLPRRATK